MHFKYFFMFKFNVRVFSIALFYNPMKSFRCEPTKMYIQNPFTSHKMKILCHLLSMYNLNIILNHVSFQLTI